MKVLVIGTGGREHALVRALKLSSQVIEVHALPGSEGIGRDALCHSVSSTDFAAVVQTVKAFAIDLVVIGPEADLVSGLADFLREQGINVFAPSQAAARLEGSKIFAKEFMQSAQVPTSPWQKVGSVEETLQSASHFTAPYVLKADGLAAGKGVFICPSLAELEAAAKKIFKDRIFGETEALLEQHQAGYELSCLVITNGEKYQILPFAQDHKRLKDNDLGPNTGGMGVIAPMKVDADLLAKIEAHVVGRSLLEIQKRELLYRGVLFIGLMITEEGPQTLEYNVRFGDPETQVLLPLIEQDLGEVLLAIARGEWVDLSFRAMSTACVVLAAPGYPDQPVKGVRIEGDLEGETASSYFLHAGTEQTADHLWQTKGGRVLNAIGIGNTQQEALDHAYYQAKRVSWTGLQMRRDIGQNSQL